MEVKSRGTSSGKFGCNPAKVTKADAAGM